MGVFQSHKRIRESCRAQHCSPPSLRRCRAGIDAARPAAFVHHSVQWLDIPGGISAQIQGHAPQGVREQKYIRRPLDLLRVHHEKIEAWILEQAGIVHDAMAKPGKLRTVS